MYKGWYLDQDSFYVFACRLSINCVGCLFLKTIFSPLNLLCTYYKSIGHVYGGLLLDCVLLHWFMCLSFHQYHNDMSLFLFCIILILGSVVCDSSNFFFFCCSKLWFPCLYIWILESPWLILYYKYFWLFHWNSIKCKINMGRENWHLSHAESSNPQTQFVYQLFTSPFSSFSSVLLFLTCRSCPCFVRFIPKYYIFLELLKRGLFWISLSNYSLLFIFCCCCNELPHT